MTTDEWTYRPETDSDGAADSAEMATDERTRSPARTSDDKPAAPQTDADAGFPSRATTMAILSHMSVLFGIPVFLVPLLQRTHPLSLHHAKAAGLIWFAFYALLGLSSLATGLLL
ncbi:MAG: hypothetical protein ABEN55_17390, partial [Bradymonadaceae bacterium]